MCLNNVQYIKYNSGFFYLFQFSKLVTYTTDSLIALYIREENDLMLQSNDGIFRKIKPFIIAIVYFILDLFSIIIFLEVDELIHIFLFDLSD